MNRKRMKNRSSSGPIFVVGAFIFMGVINMVQFQLHSLHSKLLLDLSLQSSLPSLKPNEGDRRSVSFSKRRQHKVGGEGEVNFTMNNGASVLFPANVTKFYCKRRYDRVGSAIQDYLMAHAFSFHFKRQFAGACGPKNDPRSYQSQVKMIEMLGFQEELLILDECPTSNDTSAMVLDQDLYYMWQDTDVWTSEWIEYILHQKKQINRQQEENNKMEDPTMVLHVRRGDVHPCDNNTYDRYLPNSHYLTLIDKYRTEDHHRVILHSEQHSRIEPWSDFDEIDGLELKLDTDPVETWRDILNADVYIMSKSSFSLVPALFSKASKIIYTPFWHRRQQHWVEVNNTITNVSNAQTAMLRATKCSEVFDSRNRPLKISQKAVRSAMRASVAVTEDSVRSAIRANAAWNTPRSPNRTRW